MGVSVSELKARLSEHLRRVRAGEELLVTDRGQPVARLVPVWADEADDRLRALEAAGLVRRGTGRIPLDLLEVDGPADPTAAVRQALEDERGSGW
jgi:prevent-host-death family protein